MRFSLPRIIDCPLCQCSVQVFDVISCNNIGAVHWSDGKLVGTFYAETQHVAQCARCFGYYWIRNAKPSLAKLSKWAFWKNPKLLKSLNEEQYLDAIEVGIFRNHSEEAYLRIRAWWAGNDRQRRIADGSKPLVEKGSRALANMEALVKILGTAEVELLMKADLLRHLGRMEEAAQLLSSPHPLNSEVVAQMRAWTADGVRQVQPLKFQNENGDARQAKIFKEREEAAVLSTARTTARKREAKIVRTRAIERGLATPEDSDDIIRALGLKEFRELAADFPELSRIHFQKKAAAETQVEMVGETNIVYFLKTLT